ncbi:uncharacterized protein LOC116342138 [Contarinia nasturtii]|uniref:uncharacterized protein LOC116342138 n=1 Tax=Contarinia nasturtii TaxID=265458 RepID=UPI0012D3F210|nr:uncharacterized protein LOC116342138 [Contarinia nasturtii]
MKIQTWRCLSLWMLTMLYASAMASKLSKRSPNSAITDDIIEMDDGVQIVRVTRATPVLPPGVTDDTPDLDRVMVMLDITPELYGDSASRAYDISNVFGGLIMNTARRFAAFVQYFKPLLQKSLTVKGLYPPPPTTTRPPQTTTTTTESNDI